VGIVIKRVFGTGGNMFSKVSHVTSARRCCLCKTDFPIKVKENRTKTIFALLLYDAVRRFQDLSPCSLILEDYSHS